MTQDIYRVLRYFSYFSYAPTEEEIYTFLASKCSKPNFKRELATLVKRKKVKKGSGLVYGQGKTLKYTLGRYSIILKKNIQFGKYSQSKLKRVYFFIQLLKTLPFIEFAGLSGSISMMHAKKEDDVDFFIITAPKRLWTGRFFANILAILLGLKRKRLSGQAKDKVCLNMFFDAAYLAVPSRKRSTYVAHEVLQLKPVFNKNYAYNRFLEANSWVFKVYPNARSVFQNYIKPQTKHLNIPKNSLGDTLEIILKRFQMKKISKNLTTEIVTKGQLWFFPEDFEARIMKYNR